MNVVHRPVLLIIDSHTADAELLIKGLSELAPDWIIKGPVSTVDTATAAILQCCPDLVFLDVELGGETGFDILDQLEPLNFEVILTVSKESYALQAIKHQVLDYLLKPVRKVDLKSSMERVKKQNRQNTMKRNRAAAFHKLAVPTSAGFIFISTDEIIRLQSERNYTDFILSGNRKVVVTRSLKEYEDLLAPLGFFRVHHSHIVNLNHVNRYIRGEGGYLVLSDGSNVDVSRRRKDGFLSLLPGA